MSNNRLVTHPLFEFLSKQSYANLLIFITLSATQSPSYPVNLSQDKYKAHDMHEAELSR